MFIVYPKRSLFWFNQKWRNTTSYKTVLRRWLIVWNLSRTKYAITIQNWTPQVFQVSLRSEVWATETFIKIINPTGRQNRGRENGHGFLRVRMLIHTLKLVGPRTQTRTGAQVWAFLKVYLKLTRLEFSYDIRFIPDLNRTRRVFPRLSCISTAIVVLTL